MENLINEIKNNLIVFINEDGTTKSLNGLNHTPLFNKYISESGLFKGTFNQDAHMFINLVKLSEKNDFIVICNVTDYKKSKEFDSAIIYATKNITEGQNRIIKYYLDEFKANNVQTTIGLLDKGAFTEELTLEDYSNLINENVKIKSLVRK